MLNLFLDATESQGGCDNAFVPIMIVVAVLLVAVMVIFPMITNKKQKKAVEEQRGKLSVGDTIETVGGIIGVVKEIRDAAPGRKELVIESGTPGSTTTLVIDIQALYMVLNRVGAPAAEQSPNTAMPQENIKLNEKAEKQSASADPFDDGEPETAVDEKEDSVEISDESEEVTK